MKLLTAPCGHTDLASIPILLQNSEPRPPVTRHEITGEQAMGCRKEHVAYPGVVVVVDGVEYQGKDWLERDTER